MPNRAANALRAVYDRLRVILDFPPTQGTPTGGRKGGQPPGYKLISLIPIGFPAECPTFRTLGIEHSATPRGSRFNSLVRAKPRSRGGSGCIT